MTFGTGKAYSRQFLPRIPNGAFRFFGIRRLPPPPPRSHCYGSDGGYYNDSVFVKAPKEHWATSLATLLGAGFGLFSVFRSSTGDAPTAEGSSSTEDLARLRTFGNVTGFIVQPDPNNPDVYTAFNATTGEYKTGSKEEVEQYMITSAQTRSQANSHRPAAATPTTPTTATAQAQEVTPTTPTAAPAQAQAVDNDYSQVETQQNQQHTDIPVQDSSLQNTRIRRQGAGAVDNNAGDNNAVDNNDDEGSQRYIFPINPPTPEPTPEPINNWQYYSNVTWSNSNNQNNSNVNRNGGNNINTQQQSAPAQTGTPPVVNNRQHLQNNTVQGHNTGRFSNVSTFTISRVVRNYSSISQMVADLRAELDAKPNDQERITLLKNLARYIGATSSGSSPELQSAYSVANDQNISLLDLKRECYRYLSLYYNKVHNR